MGTSFPLTAFFVLLVLLVLWGIAFWKQLRLATGILVGVVCAGVLAGLFRALNFHEMPLWLPALPFAVVAAMLSFFAFLAWYWGRTD